MYLPLTDNPEENFRATIDDDIYNFKQLWNTLGFWTLDISDADNNIIVYGVKLITKENLLKQYPQIRFDLISNAETDPGRNDLSIFNLEVTDKDV